MNAILSALVNGSIASAILAVAILILTSIRMWNAATRYILWWVALFASVAIIVVYFSADVFHEAPRPAVVQNQLPRAPVVIPTPNAGPLPRQQAFPLIVDRGTTPSLPIRVTVGSVLRWAGFAWMLTSALMLVRLIASYLLVERRKAAAVSIGSDSERRFRELFRRAGVGRRSIRIAVSDEIRGPIAVGPHRPTVLIPAKLLQELDAFELDQVVLHEAAHLSRHDDYAVFIQRVIQALLVFHPVVHWISRRIDIEREIACDDFVVLATGKALPYASCLTRVAELCGCVAASPLAASAAGSGSALVRRIETLLDDRRKASSRPMKGRLVLAATAIIGVTSAGIVAPRLVAFSAADEAAVLVVQLPVPSRADPIAVTSASVSIPKAAPEAAAPVTPKAPQAPAPLISVQVVVTDPLHRYVSGLRKEDFRILEQGVEQSITDFNAGEYGAGAVSVCIVQNTNSRNPNDFLAQPTNQLTIRAGDQLCVVDAITSLFDGLQNARTRLAVGNSPRAIVIVSDQGPDSMEYSQEQIDTLAGISDVPFYVLTSAAGVNPLLDALASRTGGALFKPESAVDVAKVLEKVLTTTRNSYVLGFYPTRTALKGELRQLEVQYLPIKGLPSLTLRYRSGYYAPDR